MASKKSKKVKRNESTTGIATGGRPGQKSWFILAPPADMSAKEVVKQAVAAGIKINEASVYGARFAAKKKGVPCL